MIKKKTALYVRVSTDAQYEEGYSVEVQCRKLTKWCELHDIDFFEHYVDGGFSGSNIERPEMKRLIEDIKCKKIERVVVYKLDRLSRSQKDTIFLLEDVFEPYNVGFISLNESFDTTTPYGKAMIGILSVFAQLERENIRERTRMGMNERVRQGLWPGGGRVPFGYDYNRKKGILEPNGDAETVKQIFNLYCEGYSSTRLADMFGFKGDKLVLNILGRKTYAGYIIYNDMEIKAQHQPIISLETYEKTQSIRKKRAIKTEYTSDYLLSGLVYCGKCGAKMRYQKWGKRTLIYCYSQQKSRKNLIKNPNCDNMRAEAFELEEAVISDIKRFSLEYIKKKQRAEETGVYNILNKRYKEITEKIKRLYNLYAQQGDEILLETINENKKELGDIEKSIEREKQRSAVNKEKAEHTKMIKGLKDGWELMSFEEKRRIVLILIDKVIYTDGEIEIYYNF